MTKWSLQLACLLVTLVVGLVSSGLAQSPPVKRSEAELTNLGTRKKGVDWPIFLGLTQDSKSPETGIITKWTAASPRIVWQRPLGTGYGAPTISKGRLFQFDRFSDQARIYSLNAETGKELWHYDYPTDYSDYFGYNNGPRCSPVVDGNRVYAYGAEGTLTCLTADTGKLVWQVNTQKDFGVVQNFFGVGSTPVVEGDLLIVMVGGSPDWAQSLGAGALDRVEGNGSGIVAFDKFTGKVKYKVSDELASYASLKLATINGRRWCLAFCRGGLIGLEPKSGKLDFAYPWRAKILESVNAAMPVVVGDEVFVSETYGPGSSLLKVSPGSSEVVWKDDDRRRAKAMMTHWNTPVYHDGYLYGSSGRHTENAELRCIEWKTGKVMWSEPGLTRSSLLYADGHFICQAEYGQLIVFKANPQKYEPVTEIELRQPAAGPALPGPKLPGADAPLELLKYPCWAAPVLSHGLLYVRGDDRLVCLELIPEKG
ncbi:PQQ-binding-like beta-propeller repeat protein [Anatilimnocola sp. NA78]|uniref:PQQ-binding-like beta-propeller repeat protein n=1 Tax=Anatilimnocola sp. NA78 TaxID=3415683 RepID=UPI003CE55BF5